MTDLADAVREALEYERARHLQALKGQGARDLPEAVGAVDTALDALVAEVAALSEALARAAFVAEHLLQMIDPETWRATGGDDGQGHYEGDYHAEKTADEIRSWRDLLW